MGRNVSEVTFMSYKLKDNVYQTPGETEKLVESINKDISKKIKTKSADFETENVDKGWIQEQQKALEAAIQKYPKRSNHEDRWLKIANCVPGKSKEQCQTRYKYLVELVKKQKEAKDQEERTVEPEITEVEQTDNGLVLLNVDDIGGGKKRNNRKYLKKTRDFYAEDSDDTSE